MKIIPILPIDTFYGRLNNHGKYYFRRSKNGDIYACRCPDRSKHHKTEAEAANQRLFAATWGKRYKK
jgi:hypothetical protein